MMTNVEGLQEMVSEMEKINLTPEQKTVALLTSIASSLAVIADVATTIVSDKAESEE